jgi:hypothetical protein
MKYSPIVVLVLFAIGMSGGFAATGNESPINKSNDGQFKPPRTADGKPDLQGVWTNVSLTTLLRSPEFKTNTVSAEEAQRLERRRAAASARSLEPTDPNAPAPPKGADVGGYNSFYGDAGERLSKVKGQYRTTWLVDSDTGQLPYTENGRRTFDTQLAFTRNNFDGPEARPMAERCIVGFGSTAGPPMINVLYNNHYQIVQTPDTVIILVEMNHDARVIRMNGKHPPSVVRPYMGDSVGRWEGDTLVVETTNFNPGERLRTNFSQSFYLSANAKVVERFTRISPTDISYEFAVDDPDIYSKIWHAEMIMSAAAGHIYEYACHEGNYALPGILAGARKAERDAQGR